MTQSLFPYQLDGAEFLASRTNALLADEMGLGKTVQAIAACDAVKAQRINVICPAVARVNWRREFAKWQTIDRMARVVRDTRADGWDDFHGVSIYSYDFVSRDMFERINRECDVLILDEAHYLTNPTAQRTKAVYGDPVLDVPGAAQSAGRVWALSGTPMRGHPATLWPMLYALAPETIAMNPGKRDARPMTYYNFRDRYCTGYLKRNVFIPTGGKNLMELKERMSPFVLRRRADDVLNLPPISFSDFQLDVKPANLPGFRLDSGSSDTMVVRDLKNVPLAEQSKWRRALGAVKAVESARVIRSELELGLYDKIVVFGCHLDALAAFEANVGDVGMVEINGSTRPDDRTAAVDRFQNDPDCKVFLGNIQAAGVAITLTAANQVFFIEMDWEPSNNAQAALRTRRIGQTRSTFARCAVSSDPMDQRITAALRRKSQAKEGVFGASIETEMAQ